MAWQGWSQKKYKKGTGKTIVKTTLVVMAAGIGSRFGGGIKQLEPVDARGHIIMDYYIYDTKEAGFDKVVFVIRKDIEEEFKRVIGNRMTGIEVEYAYQEIGDVPEKYKERAKGRTKPWGTGQAILATKEKIHEPFLVINADDYYGKEAYRVAHEYLCAEEDNCIVGFVLKKSLSDNGTVTRGVCKEEDGWLSQIVETKGIGKDTDLDMDGLVSMNMWGLRPEFLEVLERGG